MEITLNLHHLPSVCWELPLYGRCAIDAMNVGGSHGIYLSNAPDLLSVPVDADFHYNLHPTWLKFPSGKVIL